MKIFLFAIKDKKTKVGFTLMEILTALAILGGSAFILFNVYFNAMKLHQITINQTDENQLVYAACSRAEIGVLTGTLEGNGDFGTSYEGYSWSYSATAIGSDPSILLYSVNVTLYTPENESKNLTFLCYDLTMENQTNDLTGDTNKTNRGGTTNPMKAPASGFSARRNSLLGN
ncbi:MAG: type II secretion system protein [Candidatus Hydrogenedens sp.]